MKFTYRNGLPFIDDVVHAVEPDVVFEDNPTPAEKLSREVYDAERALEKVVGKERYAMMKAQAAGIPGTGAHF